MNKHLDTVPLEVLRFSLDKRAKSGLGLVVVPLDEAPLVRAQLGKEMPDCQMVDLQLEGVAPASLYRYLAGWLAERPPLAGGLVHVWGLEKWLFEPGRAGEWKPTVLVEQLNLERELMFRDLPATLLFWLSPNGAKWLAQSAPDFCNWVTIRLDFSRKGLGRQVQPAHISPMYTPEQLARFEELHQKIKQARQRAHQARKAVGAGSEVRALRDLDSLKGLLDRALE